MTFIPLMHCSAIGAAVDFYTGILDFSCVGIWPGQDDPAYAVLSRNGQELHLSSHGGDSRPGQDLIVLTDDAHAIFRQFVAAGLDVSQRPDSPVHNGPVEQTWGTTEFYVDDLDGNRLRFTQMTRSIAPDDGR